jgi:acetoacetyl-CoA synthetase
MMNFIGTTSTRSELELIIVSPSLSYLSSMLMTDFMIRYGDSKEAAAFIFEPLPFNHPLYIMYSSGTTGPPKCIVHSAGGTLIQHKKELILHCDLQSSDILWQYTTTGWMMWNWMISALSIGTTVILYDGSPFVPSPMTSFELIEEHR